MSDNSRKWITERQGESLDYNYAVKEVLYSSHSDFQKIEIVDTKGFGRMLWLDDLAMLSERDEFVYHEMIAHVPLYIHPDPRRVLIIGGGDGGTAREVLRHPEVKKCVMVEIDGEVIEACRKYLPLTASKLEDERLELKVEDGVKYVKDCKAEFDVILVDSTDPIGPAAPLFGTEFYSDLYSLLADDGLVVSQGESPYFYKDNQNSLFKIVSEVFPIVRAYNYSNLVYPGGLWTFSIGSKLHDPLKRFDQKRMQSQNLTMKYYNEDVHRGAFALPQFMFENLKPYLKPQD